MTCPNCGTMNPQSAQFCSACGTAIQAQVGPPRVQQPVVVDYDSSVANPSTAQPIYPPAGQAAPNAPQVTIINQQGGAPAFPTYFPGAADKNPGVALVLSLFFVGAGQLYNGEIGKGVLMFFGCIMLWAAMLGWIINIWSMVDAYKVAQRKQAHWQLMMSGQGNTGQTANVGL